MNVKSGVEEFQKLCRREFRFLEEDYGFAEPEVGSEVTSNLLPFEMQYVSLKTFVRVISVSYGHGLNVLFGPSEPEARPSFPAYVLEDLLKIRRPDLSLDKTIGKFSRHDQLSQMRHYARALKECADDVLRGDFSILPQLDEIMEQRRKELRWLYLREWLKEWKLAWHGCMAGWRKRRARARRN
jgi:hypothetical protein